MGEQSSIEWTDATWNPVTGCTKVSPGCLHCYAERITRRWGRDFSQVTLRPERLDHPLRWKQPRMIFTCSMSDLFHSAVPFAYIAQVFAVMAEAEQHTFQVLTKRPGRVVGFYRYLERHWPSMFPVGRPIVPMDANVFLDFYRVSREFIERWGIRKDYCAPPWPLPNVWIGTSVEQSRYLPRLDVLARIDAPIRFVSCEPLLGDLVGLRPYLMGGRGGAAAGPLVDWVIAGGESGHGAREMDPRWVRRIRDDCGDAGVPFFFKQWGGGRPGGPATLDGREWRELPERGVGLPKLRGRS